MISEVNFRNFVGSVTPSLNPDFSWNEFVHQITFIVSLTLLTLACSLPGYAEDTHFKEGLKRFKAQQKKVQEHFQRLGLPSTFDQQNDEKETSQEGATLFQIHGALKSSLISPGKLLFSKLYTRLVVGPEGSPCLIEVEDDQGFLSGQKLIGSARQSATPGRVMIDFKELVFRSGKSVPIHASALDEAGAYGISAQIFSGKAIAIAGSIASSLIAGVAASQQSQSTNAFGFKEPQLTGRNAILQGVAQSAADQSRRLIDEATAEKPILVIESETPLTVFFHEEAKW